MLKIFSLSPSQNFELPFVRVAILGSIYCGGVGAIKSLVFLFFISYMFPTSIKYIQLQLEDNLTSRKFDIARILELKDEKVIPKRIISKGSKGKRARENPITTI